MKKTGLFKMTLVSVISVSMLLSGCSSIGLAREESFESNYETKDEAENIYVSEADFVLRAVDEDMQTIDFYVLGTSELRTLIYDGTTQITDAYGQPLVIQELKAGDIGKVLYNSTISKAGSVMLAGDAFTYPDISRYSVSENGRSFTVGDDVYNIDENVHIFSGDEEIGLDRLIPNDILSIRGKDRKIFSINVDSGHGYLELKNEFALIGGWIEIGQALISQINDDMLFTVPEGTYNVRLTNTGIEEYREVTINRDNITELDLSDIVAVEPDKGVVSFNILPEDATTSIDGIIVNTNYAIRIPVGMHEISVSAQGYSTVTEYFEVNGNEEKKIEINLSDSSFSSTGSTVSENTISPSLYTYVHINTPEEAEVYEDNIYKGISPLNYKKTAGEHIITLRKNGYKTVSYAVILEDDGKDAAFDFPEMEKDEEEATVSGNSLDEEEKKRSTVSGNDGTVSGNDLQNGLP